MSGTNVALEALSLADWRRRMADLYADVRAAIGRDPDAAIARWRAERERLYREHPQSPVPATERTSFRARHFDTDPALRFEVTVEPDPDSEPERDAEPGPLAGAAGPLELAVSAGGSMRFSRIGWVDVPFPAGRRRLAVYWLEGYAGGLFLPFRDATNGTETYGAGRYLFDGAKSADLGRGADPASLRLDFNFAYQPSCAFDPRWACPLAPPENRLDLPVRAGERIA